MKKLLSKLGIGISNMTNILLSQFFVLLFDVIAMGISMAILDYGNKWLYVIPFALGILNKTLVNLIRRV